jgi:hypothetical protein
MKSVSAVKPIGGLGLAFAMAALAVCCAVNLAPISSQAQCPLTGFEEFPAYVNNGYYLFRWPSYSGNSSAFIDTGVGVPNYSYVTTEQAHGGTQALAIWWKFKSQVAGTKWLRVTSNKLPTNTQYLLGNPAINYRLAVKFWMYVPAATPDFYLSIGIRDTNVVAACGENGFPSSAPLGPIEWVGSSTSGSAPIGRLVNVKDQWTEYRFELPCGPTKPFTGNGVLNGPNLVLDGLAIRPVDNLALGPYKVYLDDFAFESSLKCPGDQVVVGACDGTANWNPATLVADCDAAVVSSTHNPGDAIGFGTTTINTSAYYPTIGAQEDCAYNVTVLQPMSVEFLSPVPNLVVPHLFAVGETIPVIVRLLDCQGQEVTQGLTVKIDVKGLWPDGVVFHDVNEQAFGVGDSLNKALVLVDHHFMFNLTTLGFARRTASNDSFYLVQVSATDDKSGLELGRGAVVLESR